MSRSACGCRDTWECKDSYCPTIAVRATAEACLPTGSPGWAALQRLTRRRRLNTCAEPTPALVAAYMRKLYGV